MEAAELGGAYGAVHSDSTMDLMMERKEVKLKERCRETSGLTVSTRARKKKVVKSHLL